MMLLNKFHFNIVNVVFFIGIVSSTFAFNASFSDFGPSLYLWITSFVVVSFLFILNLRNGKIESSMIFYTISMAMIILLSLYVYNQSYYNQSTFTPQVKATVIVLFGILFLLLSAYISDNLNKDLLGFFVRAIVFFHLLFFYIQFFLWHSFGYDLDVSASFGGAGHRPFAGDIYRATGLFDEPAIFSMYIFSFCSLLFILEKKLTLMIILSIASMLMSMSTYGIFSGLIVFSLFVLYDSNRKLLFVFLPVIVLFVFYMLDSFLDLNGNADYFFNRFYLFLNGEDGSSNLKYDFLNYWFSDINNMYYGSGLVGAYQGKPRFFESAFDITLWGSILTSLGVILGLLFCFFIYKLLVSELEIVEKIFVFSVTMKLSSYSTPYFWVYLLLIVLVKNIKKSDSFQMYSDKPYIY